MKPHRKSYLKSAVVSLVLGMVTLTLATCIYRGFPGWGVHVAAFGLCLVGILLLAVGIGGVFALVGDAREGRQS